MSYYTILRESEDQFEEKKSIFIGQIKRVNTEDEAKNFIDSIKEKHNGATNVYAYILGDNGALQRFNDGGEPKGTAGLQVLEVLKKNNLKNVVAVVTRYYGGIMLGAGGLIRAYSKGAAIAVKAGQVVEKVLGSQVTFTMSYDLFGKIQYLCETEEWHIEKTEYTDVVTILLYFETTKIAKVIELINDVSSGQVKSHIKEEEFFFKNEDRLYLEAFKAD